jgi:hypothetical protein
MKLHNVLQGFLIIVVLTDPTWVSAIDLQPTKSQIDNALKAGSKLDSNIDVKIGFGAQ